ncbi:MAG TPA: hypothetical protein VJR47_04325 [Stellaceae bacterium]|nr:hypothetical protein [Stellaceae bacterium]
MKLFRTACAFSVAFIVAGCGPANIEAYSHDKVSQEQLATLRVDLAGLFNVQPLLMTLDDRPMYKFLGPVNMNVKIKPGRHRASVRFYKENFGARDCSAEDQFVDFFAQAGHTYVVQANVQKELACSLGGTRIWTAIIVDIDEPRSS